MGGMSVGIVIRYLPAESLEGELARLEQPWIADEGALEASFERGSLSRKPRQRGLAFDRTTTLQWDESGVQVVVEGPLEGGAAVLESWVVIRDRLRPGGLSRLRRIDVLQGGVLIGSRYIPLEEEDRA